MTILVINSGSSSLKASLIRPDGSRRDFRYAHIGQGGPRHHEDAFDRLLEELHGVMPRAVGHRMVHGGEVADPARLIDTAERTRLEALVPLAPLHLPGNLLGVDLCRKRFDVPQVACFDTAFHRTMPEIASRLPIPRELGIRKYGFHGINYAHIARTLPGLIGNAAHGRVVAAHLGNGASLCLLDNLRSADTTMGFTPAGGIPMGTRSGDLDPGVMLELAKRLGPEKTADLTYHGMGLLALSDGISADMEALTTSAEPAARFAVDYFCRQASGAIGALAAKAGGIDALVFTAGIGEHSREVRSKICAPLGFLGFALDQGANLANETLLSAPGSRPVVRIPADEAGMMAVYLRQLLGEHIAS